MRTLEVWLYDELIGTITETRKGGRFSYASELVTEMRGMPLLSLSLPLKERAFGEGKTEAWFEGVLPEGVRREEMARRFGISPYDWIGLLAEIGWECAGAVRVFERGDSREHAGSYDSVSSEELAEKIANAPSRQPTPKSAAFRMSIGGFQDKMCVAMPRIDANCAFVQPEGVLDDASVRFEEGFAKARRRYPDAAERYERGRDKGLHASNEPLRLKKEQSLISEVMGASITCVQPPDAIRAREDIVCRKSLKHHQLGCRC